MITNAIEAYNTKKHQALKLKATNGQQCVI